MRPIAPPSAASGWRLAAVALAYGLVMNSAYAMLHEAEHGILHPDRRINEIIGAVAASSTAYFCRALLSSSQIV